MTWCIPLQHPSGVKEGGEFMRDEAPWWPALERSELCMEKEELLSEQYSTV